MIGFTGQLMPTIAPSRPCEIWHVHQAQHPSMTGPYLYLKETERMSYFMRVLYGPVLYKVRVKPLGSRNPNVGCSLRDRYPTAFKVDNDG